MISRTWRVAARKERRGGERETHSDSSVSWEQNPHTFTRSPSSGSMVNPRPVRYRHKLQV